MKSILKAILMIVSVAFFGVACKKGDTGSAGPQGPQGEIGATGSDGTKIYSGQGAPAASLGKNGDFFVDLATSNMYGPKSDAGWGTPDPLRGADGANGSPGSKIYSGTGAPPAGTGVAGDYFMSTDTYLFYGPKTNDGWGAPVNLKGPKGDKGDPGTNSGVVSTPWLTIPFNDWIREPDRMHYRYKVPQSILGALEATSLTDFILNKNGIVLAYIGTKRNAGDALANEIRTLPYKSLYNIFDFTISEMGSTGNESLYLAAFDSPGTTVPGYYPVAVNLASFQFVFVRPSQVIGGVGSEIIKLNNKTYTLGQLKAILYHQAIHLFNTQN